MVLLHLLLHQVLRASSEVAGGLSNIEIIESSCCFINYSERYSRWCSTFDFSDDTDHVLTRTSAAAGVLLKGSSCNCSFFLNQLVLVKTMKLNADTIANSKGVGLHVVGNSVTFDAGLLKVSATAVDTITAIADGDGTGVVLSGTTYITLSCCSRCT